MYLFFTTSRLRAGARQLAGRLAQPVRRAGLLFALLATGAAGALAATPEDTLAVNPAVPALYLDDNYYSTLEDPTGRLTIADVQSSAWSGRFQRLRGSGHPPNIQRPRSTYWLRITVRQPLSVTAAWYLELYDSHIRRAMFFLPHGKQGRPGTPTAYDSVEAGAGLPFATRPHPYKNFLFDLPPRPGQTMTYYLRLRSDGRNSFRAMLHSGPGLIPELSAQYWLLGIFYGILLIMVLYNLILFFFLKEQTYLSYVLYVLSGALLFLTEDGLGFQYLWPGSPALNHFVGAAAPVLLLLSFSTYASGFLDMASRLPALHRRGRWVVGISAALLVFDAAVVHSGFSFWLYLLPYGLLYYAGFKAYRAGLRPSRYLLLAQALVAISLTFLIMRKLGIDFYSNVYTVYSLNAAFVVEVVILSYALGEKLKGMMDETLISQRRLLKQLRKKHQAQDRLVEQMRENEELKDRLNTELEALVAQRTTELRLQNDTVANQNRELLEANGLLALQSAAIEQLNGELSRDLHAEKAARIEAREVDFGEFSQIYPDKDACLRYLANLKWAAGGYRCRKCGHEKSCEAREPHARRCTRCRYVESATAGTLLQKCKFSIVKALYAVFLLHAHRGSYSSSDLARVLELRPATSWAFAQKVLAALHRRHLAPDYEDGEQWTHVLLDGSSESETLALEAAETSE